MRLWNDRGFTFVELLIVLVIVGIMVGLAAPKLGMVFTKNKLQTSTSTLTSSLYLARARAVNDAQPYGVRFNLPVAGNINIVRDPLGDNEVVGATNKLEEGVEFIDITFTDDLVIFNELGQLDRNCLGSGVLTGTITLTDGISDTTSVEITRLTGRIRETNL